MLKHLIFISLLFQSSFSYSSELQLSDNYLEKKLEYQLPDNYLQIAKKRCANYKTKKSYVNTQSYKWHISLKDLFILSNKLYDSHKTLFNSVYYDIQEKSFMLPLKNYQSIKLSETVISSLIAHIEIALENNYADEINFSDMGHSHFLIPKDYYKKHFTKYTSFHDRYKKAFNSKKTLLLYHTAEQVDLKVTREGLNYKLPEDEYLRHRYLTRNLIGYLDGSNKLELVQVHDLNTQYNTFGARDLEKSKYKDYEWFSSGHYMYANHQACFPFKKEGVLYYFDISIDGDPYSLEAH